ncbi:MAG: hypothetical protein VYE18_09270 [Pseudomonadota bacterium]|nr:hypothetical protein [Pseudomonadota bacterium]
MGDDIEDLLRDVSSGGSTIDSAFDLEANDPIGLKTKDFGLFGAKVTRLFDDGIGVRVIYIDEIEEVRLLADLADLDAQIRADQF